jgi:hypothetical protein
MDGFTDTFQANWTVRRLRSTGVGIKDLLGPLVKETERLATAFHRLAIEIGDDPQEAMNTFSRLDGKIQRAEAFLDLMSRWRYVFGDPLDLHGTSMVLAGTHQWPEVKHLYLALREMQQRTSSAAFEMYLRRLSIRSKHHDVLFESRPLLFLAKGVSAEFEVAGLGAGNHTIDWRFTPALQDGVPILVEVKYRVGDVVQHVEPMVSHLDSGQPVVAAKPGTPAMLFPSTYAKYQATHPKIQLQGAWIHTTIKVPRVELVTYFQALPPDQLHFAVLSSWDKEGFLLCREGVEREDIVRAFGLVESDSFVVD